MQWVIAFFSFKPKSNDLSFRHIFIFLSCLIVICGTAAFIGAVPTRVFGHDIFFLLDNGWRIINGQRPHIDYYSPWGPVSFLIVGLGLILSNYSVDGVGYGSAIFGLIIGLWGYYLARYRMEFIPKILMGIYLVLLVVAPFPLGIGFLNSSHAMVYNRYGYALLGLIMIEAFQAVKCERFEKQELIGGISSGAIAAIALFLKANYFFVSAFLIGASVLLKRSSQRRIIGLFIGFLLFTLAMFMYLRFDIEAVLRDLQMAAGARIESFSFSELIFKLLLNMPLFIFISLLNFKGSFTEKTATQRYLNFQLPLLSALVFFADMVLLLSNQQNSELPLTIIFSLILVNKIVVSNRILL